MQGLGVVLGDALALVVHDAEIVLSFGVALLGGLAIPLQGLGVVLGDALALVVHEAEVVLGVGVPLIGKRTKLTNGRRIVAALIGCHGLIPTTPRRGRQAQRQPGTQHRDKREAREFGFWCGHGFPPCGGCLRVHRQWYGLPIILAEPFPIVKMRCTIRLSWAAVFVCPPMSACG